MFRQPFAIQARPQQKKPPARTVSPPPAFSGIASPFLASRNAAPANQTYDWSTSWVGEYLYAYMLGLSSEKLLENAGGIHAEILDGRPRKAAGPIQQ